MCTSDTPTNGEIIKKTPNFRMALKKREMWTTSFVKEFGSLYQGENRTGAKGTDSVFVPTHQEIREIPTARVVTYERLVVDYRPPK